VPSRYVGVLVESAAIPTETCYRHPNRSTGRHCTRCNRPACPDCLRQASVGAHCLDCVAETRGPLVERARMRAALAGSQLYATKALVGANVAVYGYEVLTTGSTSGSRAFTADWGLFGPAVDLGGEWWRLVTAGFLHAGLLHLGMNMLALWVLGRIIEPALGPLRFTLLYFAALLGGSMGALIVDPLAVTVGASGAIYGLMGALVAGARHRGAVMESGIGGLLLINLLITFAIPGISIGGHIGGLIAGALVGLVALAPGHERRPAAGIAAALVISTIAFAGGLWAATTWSAPLF
jgi:membrane associated rhomboid family serine protease